jgi:chorismate-pyruvate lyase
MPAAGPTAAELHAALLVADSATEVLERFFPPPILIRLLRSGPCAPHPGLALPADANLFHRHVHLLSGTRELSEADIWYAPDHLTAEMRQLLATTALPFGRVVRPLGLRRTTLSARIGGPDEAVALEHRALLSTPQGDAVAEVWERYGRGLFAAP